MATAHVRHPVFPKMNMQEVMETELARMVRENPVAPSRVGATKEPHRRAVEYSCIYSEDATMYYARTMNMKGAENVLLALCSARGGCRDNIQQSSNMPETEGYAYAIFELRMQVTVPELTRMVMESRVAPVSVGFTTDLHRTAIEHQQAFGANVTMCYAPTNNMQYDKTQLFVTYIFRGRCWGNVQQHAYAPASPGYVYAVFR